MTQTTDDLFRTICERPEDDAPRLAFADLIEPQNSVQAQFIRAQVKRFADEKQRKAPTATDSAIERSIIKQHGASWCDYMRLYLVPESGTAPLGCGWERGFIAYVRMAIENVVGLGARLYELAPIQHLDITPSEDPEDHGDPVRLFKLPGLSNLRSASFAKLKLGDRGASALADCEALENVSWLDLSSNQIGRDGVLALARSPMMRNKVRVFLDDNPSNPVARPTRDWDGSIIDVSGNGAWVEQEVGHAVPWLRYPWKSDAEEPDRFHARWFAPASP
jgi:uncharacterized protein (TIGR02996 family)